VIRRLLAAAALAGLAGCGGDAPAVAGARFADATRARGIEFRYRSGDAVKRHLPEGMGGGATFLDVDGDGDLDLFVTNGWGWDGFAAGEGPRKALYRNLGDGRFEDVTVAAGLASEDWGMGCVAGDVDGDGDADLYLANFGRNRLYLNDGRASFRETGGLSGVDDPRWSTAAALADPDGDGDLDLFVANYVEFDRGFVPTNTSSCRYRELMVMYGPKGYPGERDSFFRNRGDGTFEEAASRCGLEDREPGYGFQPVFLDAEGDGDADLFVANDSTPNHFYRNRGDGLFAEVGFEAGVAYSLKGIAQAAMGSTAADFDGDGRIDLAVTNFSNDNNNLYRNEGGGFFLDVAFPAGIGAPSMTRLGWAVLPLDLENDGDLDLFVVNGHLYPELDAYAFDTTYRQANQLFRNSGDGRFEEVASVEGEALAEPRVWRGATAGDVDGDGDVDLFVTALDDAPALLLNETAPRGNWLRVRLAGTRSARDPAGALVRVTAGSRTQVREVALGTGFGGGVEPVLHFGLGGARGADRVEVRWPSGLVSLLEDVPAGRVLSIVEGRGDSAP